MWRNDSRPGQPLRFGARRAGVLCSSVLSMGKLLLLGVVIMMAFFAPGVWAQSGNIQRDPFSPSGQGTASSPDEWGRDPFGNPFATGAPERHEEGKGKLLTGIIYGAGASIAIIGGEALREGDMVGDRKLVQIRKNSVVLMDPSGRHEEVFLENYSLGK
jgi:hypothetical protein